MELIRPTEITGKILSLMDDAEKRLIIVSPYNTLADKENRPWKKVTKCLQRAKERNVDISYFARKSEDHRGLDMLGITPTLIERLHAKMFLNDHYAILTSMNLVQASDEASLDFAAKTETEEEYRQVLDYFEKYIQPKPLKPLEKPKYADEIPVYDFFKGWEGLKDNDVEIHKIYYPGTKFIKELGFKTNGQKVGFWFYFSENGLIRTSEKYGDEFYAYDLDFKGKTSRYDIIISLANIVGALYDCSIEQLYFKSKIQVYIYDNPELFYSHVKKHLGIDPIDKTCVTFEGLVEYLHDCLRRKPSYVNK